MPKPNYAFEKRQRELAKKKKKEEKTHEKALRKTGGPGDDAPDVDVKTEEPPPPTPTP